ncbi:MAG TPA: DNA repair exonuclease [Thermomicrobiales bacterium]|nr:DNA repair exonuclease [Thermomicrobiales bacterium]
MKILCSGDIHIGRRSSRVPEGLDSARFSTAAAWDSIVDVALRERVDLLALSGDVVDRANRYFEAFGPLERGLRRLAEAGIDTIAVAGNHDFDVLPLLKRGAAGERLHLLGQGGQWERRTILSGGDAVLHVDGWSFPSQQVRFNPLASYPIGPDDGLPVLGLLHADLDQPGSVYAPVTLADLGRQRVALWLLGHIHHPSIRHISGVTLMYPGSPQGMDPGETGPHGPWLVELLPGRAPEARQFPTARVRYEPLAIDVSDVEDQDALLNTVTSAAQIHLTEVAAAGGDLECVAFRVTVTGRTPIHRDVAEHLKHLPGDLSLHAGHVQGFVEKLSLDTRPALSLDELSRRNDPPGALARTLSALEANDDAEACRRLIDDTLARLRTVERHAVYAGIADVGTLDRAVAREHLLREGYQLLDTLVAQRERAS